jgi:organic radical activating enzyme/TusA-related sulfurtransferase
MARLAPKLELGLVGKSFGEGLLFELQDALRATDPGELFALVSRDPALRDDLDRWARLTENSVVEVSEEPAGTRYVLRNGPAPSDDSPPLGHRLWLYTNFDCNLSCDYCCVRSSPKAARRALGLDTIRQIAAEAPPLGVQEILLTGGEPLLLADIAEALAACARAAPTTLLTNGILLQRERLRALERLDRTRVSFQISVDSSDPRLHDAHRGAGSWNKAMRGVRAAREAGFRVRLAATVDSDAEARSFMDFLDRENVAAEDRVIRPVARRGVAESGVALSRADLAPEVTITADGVYWHPVGAEDRDLFVTAEILPLTNAFQAMRRAFEVEHALKRRLLTLFHCA